MRPVEAAQECPAASAHLWRMHVNVATQHWLRYQHGGRTAFGTLEGDTITRYEGDMFAAPSATQETVALADVTVLPPTEPTKMIGLWNNFAALGAKLGLAVPDDPLYFIKASSAFIATGETIRQPRFYDGRVLFEAELGIVIGKRCSGADEAEAASAIFGYTCVNDVTAFDVLNKDASFAQWTRAKSYDTFGVFGPVVATGLDPDSLTIRGILDGDERQNYPASDMIVKPVAPGEPDLARHDADARRRDRLRHLDRCRQDEIRQHDRDRDRRHRFAAQPLRVGERRCESASSAPARSAACSARGSRWPANRSRSSRRARRTGTRCERRVCASRPATTP